MSRVSGLSGAKPRLAAVVIMSVGVMFTGRCIRGSCGGEEITGPNGELLNCDTCPVRKEREANLASRNPGTRVPTKQ